MATFDESIKPMKEMLEQHGIDLENCWNGNEALICAAAINCLECQKFDGCNFTSECACPNIYLTRRLPKTTIH